MKTITTIKSCLLVILCVSVISSIAESGINNLSTSPVEHNKSEDRPIIINLENRYYHSNSKEAPAVDGTSEKSRPINEFIVQNVEIISLVVLNMLLLFFSRLGILNKITKPRRTRTRTKTVTKVVLPPDCMREQCDSECEYHREHPSRK
jgi:hypothetical protein